MRVIIVATSIAVVSIVIAYYAFGLLNVPNPEDSLDGTIENGITPPKIILIHNENEHGGELLGYVFDRAETISELPTLNVANITSISTERMIEVEKDNAISFMVEGRPSPEAQIDTLSATIYSNQGEPITVLDATNSIGRNTYSVAMLERGESYIIVAIATWVPHEDEIEISGYAMYGYRIKVAEM